MSVGTERRYTQRNPCPVCRGHDRMERGAGVRCYGFVSEDGQYAHCSREELAGAIARSAGSETYGHRLLGPCRCGSVHGEPVRVESTYVSNGNGHAKIVATYDYRGADGALLYQVVRMEPKSFRQRKPGDDGGWTWALGDTPRVLYRLPEILAVPKDAPVFVVEGEKDADALAALGIVATCNPGGAGKWRRDYGEALAGRRVAILPDKDQVGRQHAEAVRSALAGIAQAVAVVELPGAGKDASDWLASGGTREELGRLAHEALHPAPPFRILSGEQLCALPPLTWLYRPYVPENGFVAMIGETGSGKTFCCWDMCARIALTGRAVVYVVAEGQRGASLRYRAWRRFHHADEPVPNLHFIIQPVFPSLKEAVADLQKSMAFIGLDRVDLIVFDTMAMCFIGDDNGAADMNAFVLGVTAIRVATGCAALVIHHTGWDNTRMAGNRKLQNAVDVEMKVSRDELGTITVACTKARDGAPFPPRHFRLEPVELPGADDGDPEDSCVIIPVGQADAPIARMPEHHGAVMDALRIAGSAGMTFSDLQKATGISRKPTLSETLKALQRSGAIRPEGDPGTQGRRYFADAHHYGTGSGGSEPVTEPLVAPVRFGSSLYKDEPNRTGAEYQGGDAPVQTESPAPLSRPRCTKPGCGSFRCWRSVDGFRCSKCNELWPVQPG